MEFIFCTFGMLLAIERFWCYCIKPVLSSLEQVVASNDCTRENLVKKYHFEMYINYSNFVTLPNRQVGNPTLLQLFQAGVELIVLDCIKVIHSF